MKKILLFINTLTVITIFSVQVYADLNLLGQGTSVHGTYNLIYDTDLDITWYDYASAGDTWVNQVAWAETLSVTFGSNAYTNWRLPTTVDGIWERGYDGTTTGGYNITSSEMGHLFYAELGNIGSYDTSANPTGCSESSIPSCLTNPGDFQNLELGNYTGFWSGTEYSDVPSNAWLFGFSNGAQTIFSVDSGKHAIAVHPGMLVVVPEPVSSILFLIGGATFGFRRFRKNFKK